jgi:uncharacterized phage protein gp47/JayE
MFENMTYEVILQQMLDRVSDDMDKREGSIIYDALAPAAIELQLLYIDLDTFLNEAFADTATREYLKRKAWERNTIPHSATAAVWKGTFSPSGLQLQVGDRFSCGTINFVITGQIDDTTCQLTCETPGSDGNYSQGPLIPIDYIAGLQKAQLTELVKPGNDEEDTEAFRERYLTVLRKPSTSGNIYDYYNWTMECEGVGAAKIFPLAYGPGTVKVVIADEDKNAASTALINQVAEHIEEKRPIGATVSIVSAVELPINIIVSVKLKNGLTLGEVQASFMNAFSDFLRENAFDLSYVGFARIGNLLLETAGVEDYGGLTLNGFSHNIALKDEEIAVPGAVTLEAML